MWQSSCPGLQRRSWCPLMFHWGTLCCQPLLLRQTFSELLLRLKENKKWHIKVSNMKLENNFLHKINKYMFINTVHLKNYIYHRIQWGKETKTLYRTTFFSIDNNRKCYLSTKLACRKKTRNAIERSQT